MYSLPKVLRRRFHWRVIFVRGQHDLASAVCIRLARAMSHSYSTTAGSCAIPKALELQSTSSSFRRDHHAAPLHSTLAAVTSVFETITVTDTQNGGNRTTYANLVQNYIGSYSQYLEITDQPGGHSKAKHIKLNSKEAFQSRFPSTASK